MAFTLNDIMLFKLFDCVKASSDTQVFYSSLEALVQLSEVVGSALNPHLKALLPQVTLNFVFKCALYKLYLTIRL